MKSHYLGAACACMFTLASAAANAALIPRLGGLAVYDTDLDITWLADANLAKSNTFGAIGIHPITGDMTWDTANDWIANMNAANYLGFSDWRLPATLTPDPGCTTNTAGATPSGDSTGYNCAASEMGHLFYTELGASAGANVQGSGKPEELAKFFNLTPNAYWSGTVFDPVAGNVWGFGFGDGRQYNNAYVGYGNLAMVVRSGDAGVVSTVPAPAAVWLFGGGLFGLLAVGRRKASIKHGK